MHPADQLGCGAAVADGQAGDARGVPKLTLGRRIGLGVVAILCVVIGAWVAALVFLPDAPPSLTDEETAAPVRPTLAERFGFDRHRRVAPPALDTPLAVPVKGISRDAITDSWGDPRDNGLRLHHGTDIMAPANTPVLAAADGIVEKLWTSAAGGTTVYIRSLRRNWVYYYAHLSGYAPGLHEGQSVRTGNEIGYVGDTGNAGAGNFHLHFGLTHTLPREHWYQGQDVDPYPYLAGKPSAR